MCGRFTLATPASKLIEIFGLREFPSISPRYNIAPSQQVICIRADETQQTTATSLRWGLVPAWAKDLTIGYRMINARSETAAEKPAFRHAFRSQRCLIPADGFYEWQKTGSKSKQPWYIQLNDEQPFAFAGLWETWQPRSGALGPVESCTILTTAANRDLASLHERMPVFLAASDYGAWLSDKSSVGQLQHLMKPLEEGLLKRHRVASLVGKVQNDVPQCREPLADESLTPESEQLSLFD